MRLLQNCTFLIITMLLSLVTANAMATPVSLTEFVAGAIPYPDPIIQRQSDEPVAVHDMTLFESGHGEYGSVSASVTPLQTRLLLY